MPSENQDATIKESKRYVREIVRDDWSFEPSESRTASSLLPTSTGSEVAEWRLREYDSSDSELEPRAGFQMVDMSQPPPAARPEAKSKTPAPEISPAERRRKRRMRVEEEICWNEGLHTWVEQRDVWSGARKRREVGKRLLQHSDNNVEEGLGSDSPGTSPSNVDNEDRLACRTETALAISHPPTTITDRLAEEESPRSTELLPAIDKRKESTETGITEPEPVVSNYDGDNDPDEPLIPVASPLLPLSHPIRAAINPSIYPSIYSKVVVQGLTPTVPINLADMTKAMVQGWKADGQWPPKPTPIAPGADVPVRKRGTAAGHGHGHGHGSAAAAAAATATAAGEPSKRRSSVVNAVRKVLHFSSHPFHRRGSS
ncbi:hypothetical protein ASPZODRAFT_44545, partial [Penicilliopsis zonata CBS 506.65]